VAHCGLSPHRGSIRVAPPGSEAQVAKAVSDELNTPEVNSFTAGEATACQMLTVIGDGKHK
jgi:hypothetical protein